MVSWLILQTAVAGSQSQMDVKLVLTVKLATDFFFSLYFSNDAVGDKIATHLPNPVTSRSFLHAFVFNQVERCS